MFIYACMYINKYTLEFIKNNNNNSLLKLLICCSGGQNKFYSSNYIHFLCTFMCSYILQFHAIKHYIQNNYPKSNQIRIKCCYAVIYKSHIAYKLSDNAPSVGYYCK